MRNVSKYYSVFFSEGGYIPFGYSILPGEWCDFKTSSRRSKVITCPFGLAAITSLRKYGLGFFLRAIINYFIGCISTVPVSKLIVTRSLPIKAVLDTHFMGFGSPLGKVKKFQGPPVGFMFIGCFIALNITKILL